MQLDADGNDEAFEDACQVYDRFEDAISLTPSSGRVGHAIEVFLPLWLGRKAADEAVALADGSVSDAMTASIIRDLIRFLPELGPLAGKALAAADESLAMIKAQRDPVGIIGFGELEEKA
jgi:hypothetical protein